VRLLVVLLGLLRWAQSEHTAQILNQDLGTATITHPFHPLSGQSFPILKIRRFPSGRHFSLQVRDDVISVPESWIRPVQQELAASCCFSKESIHDLLEFIKDNRHFFE